MSLYGGIPTNLVSGMSSAGAICTTQIRDAREREKREIGLLNDRLADYIEKVRFLKAQNHVLSHDIEILRRGFSGGGHISSFFESEISNCTVISERILSSRTKFQADITGLEGEIEIYRKKWLEALKVVRSHREDHHVNLDKLAEVEAQIALFNRKIRIVEEDVLRIRRETGGIQNDIGRIHSQIHAEIALKNERHHSVQMLLQRVQVIQTENSSRIEQELIYIRRDTTLENRDYFRQELQAAMRDIRANYEAMSIRSREDIEIAYRKRIDEIRVIPAHVHIEDYREELLSIRTTLSTTHSRLAEIESRNAWLLTTITDLKHQQAEEARIFEATLDAKQATYEQFKERCTELSIQMEKLCDHETSLQAELERYRVLLNGANVTTYVSNSTGAAGYRSSTHVATTTTTTTNGYSSGYTAGGYTSGGYTTGGYTRGITAGGAVGGISTGGYIGRSSSSHGISVGGNIGGVSVGGHINGYHASGDISAAGRHHESSYSYSSSNN